ncbi:MAG: ribonuclease III [Oscillospiraceae bacterium]|nr:ribonuclease III [Oscillospiraceae bacterium]
MNELETALGYRFKDPSLLETALTHTSYANECRQELREQGVPGDNQRLEFLGDAVLEMVVSRELYKRHPRKNEGELTRARAALVCEASLAAAAEKLRLREYIRVGRGEIRAAIRPSTLADALEALLAALYLDGGMKAAQLAISRFLLSGQAPEADIFDYKTAYQELIQRKGLPTPSYRLLGESGPEHEKRFESAVLVGDVVTGRGQGRSKRLAERDAAKAAMEKAEGG